ncbi:MAG: LUD domain-containing protein [Thermodesulfobacteriota bacterium]
MNGARERTRARIKAALRVKATAAPAEKSDAGAPAGQPDLAALFEQRWVVAGGDGRRVTSPEELGPVLETILAQLPPGPVAATASAYDLVPGLENILSRIGRNTCPPRPDRAKDAAAGLTAVRLALAYSGSVLVASSEPGELSASLLPPVHIALVPADRVVPDLADGLEYLRDNGPPRGAAFISGASKTADIELTVVKGVHGPGQAYAVILDY